MQPVFPTAAKALLSFVGSPTHFHEKSMEGGKSTLRSTLAGHHTANWKLCTHCIRITYFVLRIEYYVYTTTSARQFQACKDFTMHLWWSLTSNLCKHLPKLWWDQTWKHTMLSSHRGWSCVFINICVYGNMYICGSDSLHLKKSARKYLLPRTNSYQSKSKEFNTKTKHTSRHQLSAYFHFNMEGIWNIVRIEELLTKKWKFQFLISSPAVTWICIPSHT